ncbi:MAG: YfhO family protein [Christensenellales bacterium]|nr:YfhO family protein [Christensenellales bacterium]
MKRETHIRKTLAVYTGLFAMFYGIFWAGISLAGKAPIWRMDGLMQHYPYMVYLGQWLRDALSALLHGEAVRCFDFSLGFGADVPGVLNYYGFGDPLMLISVFFSGANTELGYGLLMALRSYCAGLSCMALAHSIGFRKNQTLYISLLYAFSLKLFTTALVYQAMFANPYIHFPLMILGMNQVFERRKPWVLSLAVALSGLCGFYFLFSNSVLLLGYALVMHFYQGEKRPLAALPGTAARAMGWYLLGIGICGVVLFPSVAAYFGSQRMAAGSSMDAFRLTYSYAEYRNIPLAFVSDYGFGAVPFLPMAGVFGLVLMIFRSRRRDRNWYAVFGGIILLLCVPATGWALNGFSYETARWGYASALLAAMLCGKMLMHVFSLSRREKWIVSGTAALILLYLGLMYRSAGEFKRGSILLAAVMTVLTAAVLLGINTRRFRGNTDGISRGAAALVAVLVVVNMGSAHYRAWLNRMPETADRLESYASMTTSPYAGLETDGTFGRTDTDARLLGYRFNASSLENVAGTSVYNSILPSGVDQLMTDTLTLPVEHINVFSGLQARAPMQAIWAVNQYVTDAEGIVPYGFELAGETEQGYRLYERSEPLPVATVMNMVMSRAQYDALSPLEKQWALTQCAVTEDTGLPEASFEGGVVEVPIDGMETENLLWQGEDLTAEAGGTIRLTFDAPEDCELYLVAEGLKILGGTISLDNQVEADCHGVRAGISLMPESFELTRPLQQQIIHLGYSKEGRTTAELRFAQSSEYRLKELKLYAQPMTDFRTVTAQIRDHGMENVAMETNGLSGTVTMDEPGILVFSIPADKGWTAIVDGQRMELTDSAGALLALELREGYHSVTLSYETPGLTLGAAASLVSLMLCLSLIFRQRAHSGKRSLKGEIR